MQVASIADTLVRPKRNPLFHAVRFDKRAEPDEDNYNIAEFLPPMKPKEDDLHIIKQRPYVDYGGSDTELKANTNLLNQYTRIVAQNLQGRTKQLAVDYLVRRLNGCATLDSLRPQAGLRERERLYPLDGLGPSEYTEEHIIACIRDSGPGHVIDEPLFIRPEDVIWPHYAGTASGIGSGYAVSGDFFVKLDAYATTLPPQENANHGQPPQGYLFKRIFPGPNGRWNLRNSSRHVLTVQAVSTTGPTQKKVFNLFMERKSCPTIHGPGTKVYQYLGRFTFLLDRDRNGESLTAEELDELPYDERPDLHAVPGNSTPEEEYARLLEISKGRQRMAFYIPRVPYFEYESLGLDRQFAAHLEQFKSSMRHSLEERAAAANEVKLPCMCNVCNKT